MDILQSNKSKNLKQPTCLSDGCELQPHQLDSLTWLAALYSNQINGILADDMVSKPSPSIHISTHLLFRIQGMGKTIQAIAIMAYLRETKKIGSQKPHLVIAPKSTISNWMKEFKKWAPFFTVVNLIPTVDVRYDILKKEMKPGHFDVCVTTYEALRICRSELRRYKFHYVIFDEAHKLKSDKTVSFQCANDIKSYSRLLLTGTPLQNNIGELWCLLNFLMPQVFHDKEEFQDLFDFSQFDQDPALKLTMVKKMHQILMPFILRRTKKDLAKQLPEKIEINLSVPLAGAQIDLYHQFLMGINETVAVTDHNNMLMQLRKVCNHPYLFVGAEPVGSEEYGEHIIEASGKLLVVDKLLKKTIKQKEQTLLFSQFTSTLDIIEDYCVMRDINFCRLDGTTP